MEIIDGTGSGKAAKVSADNRLHTFSLIEYPMESFSHNGDSFVIPTEFIALTTTASYTGILYLTNTSVTHNIHIERVRTSSTAGTLWKVLKNPTAGTLISAGTAVTPVNYNYSSGRTLTGTAKKGVDAQTITDGTWLEQWQTGVYQAIERQYDGTIIVGAGNSIAILAQPSAAATVGVTLSVWIEALK